MRVAGFVILASFAAWAQGSGTSGSIAGILRESGSGKALEETLVEATGVTRISVRSESGRFSIGDVPPGVYQVKAVRVARMGMMGSPMVKIVEVRPHAESTADFEFPQLAEVSGRVVDPLGAPVAGVTVRLVYLVHGIDRLEAVSTHLLSVTNDLGEYDINLIDPGVPFLLYAERTTNAVEPAIAETPMDPALRRPALAATFYPGSTTQEGAQSITFRPGEHREHVDTQMVETPSYCLDSRVAPPSSTAAYVASLDVANPVTGLYSDTPTFRRGRTIQADEKGRIRVCGLSPGEYRISVDPKPGPRRSANAFYGTGRFSVPGEDVTQTKILPRENIPVAGEILWEGPAPKEAIEGEVRLDVLSMTQPGEGMTDLRTPVPGRFDLGTLRADNYLIRLLGIPTGAYLKDIVYGPNSVLKGGRWSLRSQADAAQLKIVLGGDGGKLQVTVLNEKGQPSTDHSVLLIPQDVTEAKDLMIRMRTCFTGKNGSCDTWTYRFDPPTTLLAPGRYYLLATDVPYNRPADVISRIWSARTSATEVVVEPGGTAQITIRPTNVN